MYKVSITIPARNEENYIEKCLQSIVDCTYPKDLLQVFVCDGLSTDSTREKVLEYEKKYPYIKLLINKKKTTPYALNIGLKASNSDFKIILGAHSEIAPNFITENVNAFNNINNEKLACVGGLVQNIYENEEAMIIGAAMSSKFGVGNAHYRTGKNSGFVDTVLFGAYKSEIFEQIGYFDESLTRNQDDEYNYRLLKNGYKIFLSNKIKSKYHVRSSYAKLFKQFYQYGYWKVIVNKKYKSITTLRQIAPLLFILFLTLGPFFSFIHILFAYLYILGLALYFGMAFFVAAKSQINTKNKMKMLKAFLILHLSYGFGYLISIKDLFFYRNFKTDKNIELTR